MPFVIAAKASGKELLYAGDKFSSTRTPQIFSTKESAKTKAEGLLRDFRILGKYRVYVRPFRQFKRPRNTSTPRKTRVARKSNPDIRDPELAKAGKLLKDFSGHAPSQVLRVGQRPMKKGLVIGQLDGVLYTTVRDGKVEAYIHKFRKRSRPLLTASADGKQLGIVGGRFQMTEAGIEDR